MCRGTTRRPRARNGRGAYSKDAVGAPGPTDTAWLGAWLMDGVTSQGSRGAVAAGVNTANRHHRPHYRRTLGRSRNDDDEGFPRVPVKPTWTSLEPIAVPDHIHF